MKVFHRWRYNKQILTQTHFTIIFQTFFIPNILIRSISIELQVAYFWGSLGSFFFFFLGVFLVLVTPVGGGGEGSFSSTVDFAAACLFMSCEHKTDSYMIIMYANLHSCNFSVNSFYREETSANTHIYIIYHISIYQVLSPLILENYDCVHTLPDKT